MGRIVGLEIKKRPQKTTAKPVEEVKAEPEKDAKND